MKTTTQLGRPRIFLWPDGNKAHAVDLGSQCVGFDYTKSLAEPAGRWSVELAPWRGSYRPGHPLHLPTVAKSVRPNAVISIGFEEPGGICMGLVDNVSPPRGFGGATVSSSITLSGTDMAKVLTQDHIVHASLTVAETPEFIAAVAKVAGSESALLAALPGVWGPESETTKAPVFIGASVEDVVKWILRAGPSMRIPILAGMGGTGAVAEFIKTDGSVTTWNDARLFSEAPHTYNGNTWGFITSILDTDFYELFVDTLPRTDLISKIGGGDRLPACYLTIRPKPFDSKLIDGSPLSVGLKTRESTGITWDTLRTRVDGLQHHDIPIHEVIGTQLGISDADVFSYYLITSDNELIGNPDGLKEGLFYPTVDLFTLQRAGLRSYEGRLSLAAGDLVAKQLAEIDYDSEVADEVIGFRNRVANWYRLAEYFEAGSIQVAGRDRYRIGDPVNLGWHWPMRGTARGVRFYCVSTSHKWTLGGNYTTTLRLTRGHNKSVVDQARLDISRASVAAGLPGTMWATT